jgi:tetratricopeptide (TPR) repeat protein
MKWHAQYAALWHRLNDDEIEAFERMMDRDFQGWSAGDELQIALDGIAEGARRAGRRQEAQDLLRRVGQEPAPERQPQLGRIRAQVDSLTALGQWHPALQAYGEYGKLGFEISPEDKLRLGRLQVEVANFDLALRLLTEAEAAGEDDAELYLHKGRALRNLGRTDEAIADLQRAVGKDPDLVAARIALARMYLNQGDAKRALDELEAVAHLQILDPKLADEYSALRDSLRKL